MKYIKKTFLAIVAGAAFTMSLSAWAAAPNIQPGDLPDISDVPDTIIVSELPPNVNWGYSSDPRFQHNKLGLTDEQMEQLMSLKSDYETNTARQKAELKANKKKMGLLLAQASIDNQAVMALNEKIKALKSDLSDARVNHMLKAANVMTPKQREQIRHHVLTRSLSDHKSGKYKHCGASSQYHHRA